MRRLVNIFTKQLTEGLEIDKNANLIAPKNQINSMVITGLGGSGIGGKIAFNLFQTN